MRTFRILEKSEVGKLSPVLDSLGWRILYPEVATILAAEEDGEIVGFCVMQVLPHLEPEWVKESHRGTGLADELAKRAATIFAEGQVRGFLSVAGNAHAERICRDVLGMKKVEGAIYRQG